MLASNWTLFVARAVIAFLLAVAIVATDRLHLDGFIGMLGLYAVTDGVLAGIAWLRERHFTQFGLEGALSIATGLTMLVWSDTAAELLVVVAARAIVLGAVQGLYSRRLHGGRNADLLLIGAGLSMLVGVGFLVVTKFGYDALDLHVCIAGYLAIFGGELLTYGLKLHGWQRRQQQEAWQQRAQDSRYEGTRHSQSIRRSA
jgi:uncharacterized membrane protein HdeD (DUF308 family)